MALSSKHHYLPQFYLKGFTDDNGRFSIFDHQKKFLKKGDYYPVSHFFGIERNTVQTPLEKTDFIESCHALKDSKFAKLFEIIRSTKRPLSPASQDMFLLKHFVFDLYWRLPVNDQLFLKEYENNTAFRRFWFFRDKTTGQKVKNQITDEIEKRLDILPQRKNRVRKTQNADIPTFGNVHFLRICHLFYVKHAENNASIRRTISLPQDTSGAAAVSSVV